MSDNPNYHLSGHSTGRECIGILLAGGMSKRFGSNKLVQTIDGQPVAKLSANALSSVCRLSFEAGTGLSGLPRIHNTLGSGPLAAIAESVRHLRDQGILSLNQCALILAGDVPSITASTLHIIANWPGAASVVPVVNGQKQYLAARWSARSLDRSNLLVRNGILRVRDALNLPETQYLSMDTWDDPNNLEFLDIDTLEELHKIVTARQIYAKGRSRS